MQQIPDDFTRDNDPSMETQETPEILETPEAPEVLETQETVEEFGGFGGGSGGPGGPGGPVPINEERSIPMCIVLSLVTCGIYSIYWFYRNLQDLYMLNGLPNKAGQDILLSIVTCGIYGAYMRYQMGGYIGNARQRVGLPGKNDGVIYLVVSLIGGAIIIDAIIQNELNIISRAARNQ